jgi:deoxyribonuclease-4
VPRYFSSKPPSIAKQQDILKLPAPTQPPKVTSRRIGIHTSIAGGVQNAAERAYRLGCNTLQIFSSSPRQWQPYSMPRADCDEFLRLRQRYDLKPLVIHNNYLVNLASTTPSFLKQSIESFRGEIERALALSADYLVLHPGSFRGANREQGLRQTAAAAVAAAHQLDLAKGGLTILIENSAGAEYSLGATFEQVAEVIHYLRDCVPVGACIDTCHTHVAGYDVVSEEGSRETLSQLDKIIGLKNVRVWHCNDAKSPRGTRLDRHQHVGKGTIGSEPFRRLLNNPKLKHAAFIAETPIDEPGDDRRNVDALKALVAER